MALDFLSIPPMSDALERTFSGGRRTISWTRARLKLKNVEMVETMVNLAVNGLIPPDTAMKELLEWFAELNPRTESDVDSSDE
jgi:hAT family C-terminal dimerisation region